MEIIILNLLITIAVYILVPFIISRFARNLSNKTILSIVIFNGIACFFLFNILRSAFRLEVSTNIAPALLWSSVNHWILKKKCLIKDENSICIENTTISNEETETTPLKDTSEDKQSMILNTSVQTHNEDKKHFSFKTFVFKFVLILVILFLIGFTFYLGYLYGVESESSYLSSIAEINKETLDLFEHSSVNPADIYGLSNENNILGKPISEILAEYKETEDYTVSTNEYFTSYIFPVKDTYCGHENANLVVYTPINSSIINMFEYQFKTDAFSANHGHYLRVAFLKLKDDLTYYYEADPTYTYVDVEKQTVDITKDTFDNLISENHKSLYRITWKSEKGIASLSIPNTNIEAPITCSVSFILN